MERIAHAIDDALTHRADASRLAAVRAKVADFTASFPLYDSLSYL